MTEWYHPMLQQHLVSARATERGHIARELHDQIIQQLIGLHYQLSEPIDSDQQAVHQLAHLRQQIHALIHRTRDLCGHIHSSTYDGGAKDMAELAHAIQRWIESFARTCALQICVQVDGARDITLDQDSALALFRVVQEALVNIHRHARATHVVIQLRATADAITLHIHDDGIGFCPITARQQSVYAHYGVLGMQERIEQVSGTFQIQSQRGQGTSIAVWIPRHDAHHHALSPWEKQYAPAKY